MFLSDTESTGVERSEMAIRALCRGVDITGAEVVEIKRIAEGSRYRTYVLVALPTGEANQLSISKERKNAAAGAKARADRAFNELDNNKR
jgi:aspartate 1-decarboxylase